MAYFMFLAFSASAAALAMPQFDSTEPSTGAQQAIPSTPKAPGTFSNDAAMLAGEPAVTGIIPPDVYGARDIDLPFGRFFNGNVHFFKTTNNPTSNTSSWGSQYDNADQSACGIPANAYFVSGAAIHPYFLKYAGLDRYCMQDVCIHFYKEDGSTDMLLKVTDICTPDSADGIPCTDPMDIKIDRTKAGIMFNENGVLETPEGDTFPQKMWWYFAKCMDDGLVQPAYQNNSNWFADPYLPNNEDWAFSETLTQYTNNQKSYPAMGWETYPGAEFNVTRVATPINDYDPANLPAWSPIAGGRGSSLASTPVAKDQPANSAESGSSSAASTSLQTPLASGSLGTTSTSLQTPSAVPTPSMISTYSQTVSASNSPSSTTVNYVDSGVCHRRR